MFKFASLRFSALGAFSLIFLALSPAFGAGKPIESNEGTTDAEIQALKPLPAPSTLKVVVMPFSSYDSDVTHVKMASAANWMLFDRQGFDMLPLVPAFEAVKKDGEIEPGLPLRKSDAVRLGKMLGANWVVYGEVKELRPYKKESFFTSSKNMWASMRVAIVDVEKGDLIFWQVRSRKIGGTGMGNGAYKSGETLARTSVLSVSDQSLAPLMAAFPEHEVKGKVPDSGDLASFVNQTWSDKEAK